VTDAKVWLSLFRVTDPGCDRMIRDGVLGDVSVGLAMRVAGLCDVKFKIQGGGDEHCLPGLAL
jgi:hypothetical protein